MSVGCYVIGESEIHLSADILPTDFYATEDYVTYFKAACKKLPEKLKCLVIVDAEYHDLNILKKIYDHGMEYADVVYIIPPIVAFLQYAVETIRDFDSDLILISLQLGRRYYTSTLTRENNSFSTVYAETVDIASLQNLICYQVTDIFCFSCNGFSQKETAQLCFPGVKFFSVKLESLALGGFWKAVCIAEPGTHLEVLNFTLGLWNRAFPSIVNRCARFPIAVDFIPLLNANIYSTDMLLVTTTKTKKQNKKNLSISTQKIMYKDENCTKQLYIQYNAHGLLQVKEKKQQISFSIFNIFIPPLNVLKIFWMTRQLTATFNFVKQGMQVEGFTDFARNTITYNWLNSVGENSEGLPGINGSWHTVFVDEKCRNYKNGPIISITPEYVGFLQYCITYFLPSTTYVIVILATKKTSTFYAMIQRSHLCYTITHIGEYSNACKLYSPEMISHNRKLKIFWVHESGVTPTLALDQEFSTNVSVTRFEISNLEEIIFYGGALYALQNSVSILSSPYVTFDPLFHPEDNYCEGYATISRKPLNQFHEFDAVLHGALSMLKLPLFWGDLIAVLLPKDKSVYIFYFCHIDGKFLLKEEETIACSEIITSEKLHSADHVIIENSQILLMTEKNFQATYFKWDRKSGKDKFMVDLDSNNLLIYDTPLYSDAISRAVENELYCEKCFEKYCMAIEFLTEECRILVEDSDKEYLVINDREWIPMQISFNQSSLFVNKESSDEQDNIVYDFVKLLGATSYNRPPPDPSWTFQLAEMNDSKEIGYKVKTQSGSPLILSPEMALSIFLKKLLKVYEKFSLKRVTEINFKAGNMGFTEIQKASLENVEKLLKIDLNLM